MSLALFLITGAYYLVQHPYFRVAQINIQAADSGSLKRAKVQDIFQAVRPELTGSFFTVDLQQAKQQALAQTWVKNIKIDRIAPNRIDVFVEEHEAAARWIRNGVQAGLINADGDAFHADYPHALPELDGEFSQLSLMLQQYRTFESRLKPLRLGIKRLQYSARGSWTLMLSNGIEVRLGKENIHAQLMRFTDLWAHTLASQAAYIDYVDMRYPDGAAMKRRDDAPVMVNENLTK